MNFDLCHCYCKQVTYKCVNFPCIYIYIYKVDSNGIPSRICNNSLVMVSQGYNEDVVHDWGVDRPGHVNMRSVQ